MKYIVDIPSSYVELNGKLLIPYTNVGGREGYFRTGIEPKPYKEPDRKAIEQEIREKVENEVWELVRKITSPPFLDGMEIEEIKECFGNMLVSDIFIKMTYQEAKAKYDAWRKEERKKIKVGDECMYGSKKCIVNFWAGEYCEIIYSDGESDYDIETDKLTPTGKHYPQLEEMFKQMRGESNAI